MNCITDELIDILNKNILFTFVEVIFFLKICYLILFWIFYAEFSALIHVLNCMLRFLHKTYSLQGNKDFIHSFVNDDHMEFSNG